MCSAVNGCLYRIACVLTAALVSTTLLSGCSVIESFQPETIRIDQGEITIKGWVDEKKSEFCVKIELKKHPETVSLHSLNVVRADGVKVETVAKDDMKKLVAAADFVTKKQAPGNLIKEAVGV